VAAVVVVMATAAAKEKKKRKPVPDRLFPTSAETLVTRYCSLHRRHFLLRLRAPATSRLTLAGQG
jgi:hypothetical protein